jgi:hypothetical protein
MGNLIKTKRTFINVETQKRFSLYQDEETKNFELIFDTPTDDPMEHAPGTTINGFYIAAHDDAEIKLNKKKIVKVPRGTFYNLKEGEKITHRRFTALKMNFRKV